MGDDLPDETLMQRIARDDAAAFDVLFVRHRRAVFSYTFRMVGEGPTAEDLTQECFLRVWQARARYQPTAVFRTWLFTIARRLALDELKRRETHPLGLAAITAADEDATGTVEPIAGAEHSNPQEIVIARELAMSSASDLPTGTRLRESVTALATDPLALRAVRKLVEPFFDGKPMQVTKTELAAALAASEAEVEASLRPLVADKMLRWSKTATGEESYELENQEPHVLLLQSLE